MKAKNLTVLLFFLLISQIAYSQVLVGATAGGNFSWMSFGDKGLKNTYSISPVFGYHFGGHVSFKVRKRFFLHTSLIYSTKGMVMKGKKEENDAEDDLYRLTARYNYIEMPILYTAYFKGTLRGGKVYKFSLGIGPNISYWLGGKGTVENDDTHEFSTGVTDYKIVFNKDPFTAKENEMVVEDPTRIQLGLNLAAGFLFEPARDREILLTVRYEIGHSYLSRESVGSFGPTYFEQPLKIKNQGFRVSLAYTIDLKLETRKKGKSTVDPKKRRY